MTPAERKELDAVRLELKGDLSDAKGEILTALREHAAIMAAALAARDSRLEVLEAEHDARIQRASERASWANRAKWALGMAASAAVVLTAAHPWG